MPKPNFYQSLHTTVMGETGQPFEVQIRTREMDLIAERGIAAHWKYKEGRLGPHADDARFQWLRQLVDWQSEVSDPRQFLSSLKVDLYPDEVYTFTPEGRGLRLPARGDADRLRLPGPHGRRATAASGARVNGKLVPLRTPLSSGDIVEILTAPNQTPSRDWLSFVVDEPRAAQDPPLHPHAGEARRRSSSAAGCSSGSSRSTSARSRSSSRRAASPASSSSGGSRATRTSSRRSATGSSRPRTPSSGSFRPRSSRGPRPSARNRRSPGSSGRSCRSALPDIVVVGHNDLLASLAKCCNPVPGEKIVGLHHPRPRASRSTRRAAPTSRTSSTTRSGRSTWPGRARRRPSYAIELEVVTDDRPGLLADVTQAIAGEGSNIRRIEARVGRDARRATSRVSLETSDLKQLEKILGRIRAVAGVRDVIRKYNVPKAGERVSSELRPSAPVFFARDDGLRRPCPSGCSGCRRDALARHAVDDGAHRLQVQVPLPVRHVVRVADAVAAHRGLSAELAVLSHGSPRLGRTRPKKPAKPTPVRAIDARKNSWPSTATPVRIGLSLCATDALPSHIS